LPWLRQLADNSADSYVMDPPYSLSFMNKSWDKALPDPAIWREVLRVVKPGGHLIAFGGTRTVHRLACALEDAGWEIRDTLHWCYWSGFPKSKAIDKAIDDLHGVEREVVRTRPQQGAKFRLTQETIDNGGFNDPARVSFDVTAPATPDAQRWAGWGSAVKPAVEPAILARAPLSESSIARNVLRWGTGGINVDGCRFAPGDAMWAGTPKPVKPNCGTAFAPSPKGGRRYGSGAIADPATYRSNEGHPGGRYPANLLHCPKASRAERERGCAGLPTIAGHEAVDRAEGSAGLTPRAGAGRSAEKVANGHPCVKPVRLLRYLVRLVTPPGGMVLDPFAGSGSCGVAAVLEGFRYSGCELEPDYHRIAKARIAHAQRYPDAWTDTARVPTPPDTEREAWERAGQLSLVRP